MLIIKLLSGSYIDKSNINTDQRQLLVCIFRFKWPFKGPNTNTFAHGLQSGMIFSCLQKKNYAQLVSYNKTYQGYSHIQKPLLQNIHTTSILLICHMFTSYCPTFPCLIRDTICLVSNRYAYLIFVILF